MKENNDEEMVQKERANTIPGINFAALIFCWLHEIEKCLPYYNTGT